MSSPSDRGSPIDAPLWQLVRAASVHSGEAFFHELTKNLSHALGMRIAVVSELAHKTTTKPLSVWIGDAWSEAPLQDLGNTPCGLVVASRRMYVVASGARDAFSKDERMTRWGVESYIGAPLIGSNGKVLGLLCLMDSEPLANEEHATTILDVFASRAALELDRIQTLRELNQQRAFLRQVLDINPSLIFAKDRKGRFTLVNQAIADVYGTTIDDLTGKTDADFNPNEDEVAFFRQMDLEVMDTGQERFIAEEPLTDAAGRQRWVQTIKRAIVDEDGTSSQVLGVATDITEVKLTREALLEGQKQKREKVEAELEKVKQELVRHTRLAAIGQVAASIAHELRNPLGAINNSIFFLSRHFPEIDAKWSRHLDIMRQEVVASDRIVTNLMEMSRANEPAKEATDFGATIRHAFDRVIGTLPIELTLVLDPEPFQIHADPEQMRQVMNNLMMNAAQSMPNSGTIFVEGRREGGEAIIVVRDEGGGIDPRIREEVFEPLFTTKAKGTGLGLAICRQIVERHRGSIRLLAVERGAAFEIRLPDE